MKKLFVSVVLLAGTLFANVALAQLLFAEGKDYTVLENPLTLQKSGEKEVLEFFSYSCPHCYNLEPQMIKWIEEKKPEDVGFYQVPATGGKLWTFTAQVKYTADKLGLGHEFGLKYFEALHKDRNRRLMGDKEAVIDFMVKEGGADKAKAEKAWSSLQVKSGLKRSAELFEQAGLTGVPAVVVNGKYLVQLTEFEKFFSVIDFLLSTTSVE